MAKFSHLKDRHGNDLYFGDAGDVWVFPVVGAEDFREHRRLVRHMELRDGDVILVSFPRSGTFWHHEILTMLMNGNTEHVGELDADHLECYPFEKLPRPDHPQLYASHLHRFRLLPQQVLKKKVKVIYSYRNPKDTLVSFYNFLRSKSYKSYEGSWSHFFDLMMDTGYIYGNWFDHVCDWEEATSEHPGLIFPSCYELMKRDPVGQIQKLDQFLGLNRGRELCEKIAEACHFTKLKAAKEGQPGMERLHGKEFWKDGVSGIYRKGEIGDWKNWFTVAQNEQFDAEFERRMSRSKLPFFFQ